MGIHKPCTDCELAESLDQTSIQIFLEEKYEISRFLITDGVWLLEKRSKLHFSSGGTVDCGNQITKTREVDFQTDFFNVLRVTSHSHISFFCGSNFKFVGKEPLPGEYNAAVVKRLGEFNEGGYGGSCDYEMWSLLLVKVEVRYKTAEERAEDERRRNLPPDPSDDGPPF